MDLKKLVSKYVKLLSKRKEMENEYNNNDRPLRDIQAEVEKRFHESNEEVEVSSEILDEVSPFWAWSVQPKDAEMTIRYYRILRDKKDTLTKTYNEQKAQLDQQLELFEGWLLKQSYEMKTLSFRTDFGTATRQVKTRYSTQDWESFVRWTVEHNAEGAIERRIKSSFMDEVAEEDLPSGINKYQEVTMQVRKPSN